MLGGSATGSADLGRAAGVLQVEDSSVLVTEVVGDPLHELGLRLDDLRHLLLRDGEDLRLLVLVPGHPGVEDAEHDDDQKKGRHRHDPTPGERGPLRHAFHGLLQMSREHSTSSLGTSDEATGQHFARMAKIALKIDLNHPGKSRQKNIKKRRKCTPGTQKSQENLGKTQSCIDQKWSARDCG